MGTLASVSNTIYYSGKQMKLRLRQGNGNKTATDIYRVANIYLDNNPDVVGTVLKEVTNYELKALFTWNRAITLIKKCKSILDMPSIRQVVEDNVSIPVMINDKFDVRKIYGTAGSEDQTFVTAEYLDTIAIAVAIQIVLPIIITAVNTMLLTRTANIVFITLGNITENIFGKYVKKLMVFISTIATKVNGKRHNRVIRLNDVPEEDLPKFILGNIVLLRMPTLRYEEPDPKIRPSNAWPINSFKRAVENTMRIGTMGNSSINEKTPPTEQDGITKMSTLDDSSVSTMVATDQVIAAEFYLDSGVIHDHLGIPPSEQYDDLVNTFTQNTTEVPQFNLEVIKLITFYVFPYGLIPHMEQRYMALLQAVCVDWLIHHKLVDIAYVLCSRPGVEPHRLGAYRSVEDNGITPGDVNDHLKYLINFIKDESVYILDDASLLIKNGFTDNVTKASLAKELLKLITTIDK